MTSNIWGTKFKIHGLATSVPANLGQVTYKTSLLHLQPRQMTLIITELRDDVPPGPDPNFNPNVFSEDEEEAIAIEERKRMHVCPTDHAPPIAPMSPRGNRFNRPKSQLSNHFLNSDPVPIPPSTVVPALARAESYDDEFLFVDTHVEKSSETLRPTSIQTRNLNSPGNSIGRNGISPNGQGRHAVSPLCCDGSVPALQSPKNAVAPSDIIFDRPPVQTLVSYSNSEFTNHVQVKSDKNSVSVIQDNSKNVKKVDVVIDNKLNTDSKISGKEQFWKEKCANKNSSNLIGMSSSKEIKFIDEEQSDNNQCSSIPKSVSTAYLTDSMVRSCSVGYLDLVDAQLVPCNLALHMLRKDAPKRLVLVNRKNKQKKNKKHHINHDLKLDNLKSPKLSNCGKSKSLDSSDLFPSPDLQSLRHLPNLPNHKEEVIEQNSKDVPPPEVNVIETDKNAINISKNENSKLNSKTPLSKRKKSESETAGSSSPVKTRGRSKNTSVPNKSSVEENPVEPVRINTPLHTHALNTLENLLTRLRDMDDNKLTPPSSPRLPRSSPASPAPTKKGKRPQSASPIRKHLLNSPLLGRRSRKSKLTESSDDEVGVSGDEVVGGKNYKDLETFQKAQLRQKVG